MTFFTKIFRFLGTVVRMVQENEEFDQKLKNQNCPTAREICDMITDNMENLNNLEKVSFLTYPFSNNIIVLDAKSAPWDLSRRLSFG